MAARLFLTEEHGQVAHEPHLPEARRDHADGRRRDGPASSGCSEAQAHAATARLAAISHVSCDDRARLPATMPERQHRDRRGTHETLRHHPRFWRRSRSRCSRRAAASPGRACAPGAATIATFSPGDWGSFAEGMAADSHGNLYVSLTVWGYYDEETAELQLRRGLEGRARPRSSPRRAHGPHALRDAARRRRRPLRPRVRRRLRHGVGTIPNGVYRLRGDGSLTQVVALPGGRVAQRHGVPRRAALHHRHGPRRRVAGAPRVRCRFADHAVAAGRPAGPR